MEVWENLAFLRNLKFLNPYSFKKPIDFKNLEFSETSEIFLIWTNVITTNVDWTNITITVGIC